ncbi:alpha/beta hydrolase [Gilvimarinus xylanilyticus]|uniref:Alpha/beta hydrolase n=1 Tax=Gilvimarinus xylanilyticus TaxID=2944139 RepID=A0A9X2I5W1_9GAMM|nr:alpha/beta hydrolase [Gilvimarinus xylanilyticus]MCP8900905.1 alpha/beta hydrolase [Gilvimarinus xylanilyticus]
MLKAWLWGIGSAVLLTGCGGQSSSSAPVTSSSSSLATISSSSVSSVPVTPPEESELTVKQISWGDRSSQFGNLYLPQKTERTSLPVVVMIHGGCWREPYGLELQDALSRALAARDLAVWNIEYRRLGGGGEWPALFQDVASATDYLPQLAVDYPLDTSRVVSMGHSAGGHLALWLASRENIDAISPLYRSNPQLVAGAISLAGVADLEAPACGDSARRLIDAQALSPGALQYRLSNTSPINMLPTGVPTVLFSGTRDGIVVSSISEAYVDAAIKAGDTSEHLPITGADHFDLIDPLFMDVTLLADTVESMVE